MNTRKLTRRELYDLVWSTPMTKLAPRFGISDVALRKRCHNHEVPTPGAGYWAQLAAGHEVNREPLPEARPHLENIVFEERESTVASPKADAPVVSVSDTLKNPHSAVTWLEEAFEKGEQDQHGRVRVGFTYSPGALITKSSRNRALCLLDALFKALEARGHAVEARVRGEHSSTNELLVAAHQELVAVHIEEKLDRKPHTLTADERRDKERWEKRGLGTWDRTPKYDYFPNGELKLSIGLTHYKYNGRKSVSDTKTQRVDDLLGTLVLAIEAAAQVGRHERLEAERLQRERHEAERKRLRGERLRWYQRKLAEELEEMSSAWKKAAELREFLSAYDRALPGSQRNELAETWFVAAKKYADKLDPLAAPAGLAKDLEPSDEELEQLIAADKARSQR